MLAALLALIVTITAITQCSRQTQRAAAAQEQIAPAGEADSNAAATDKNIVGLATRGDSAVIHFHPTLRSGAAQGNSGKITAKRRANLKATKQKPGRKVKPLQPDRKSPLESPV